MVNVFRERMLAAMAGLWAAAVVVAQPAPLPSVDVPIAIDSGLVFNDALEDAPAVVFATDVRVAGATWLRLKFSTVELSGDPSGPGASYLRITSLLDGAVQFLDAVTVRQWNLTSAYFNGEAVRVELLAYPGTGLNRIAIGAAVAGQPFGDVFESICGPTDDRVLSEDPRQGRFLPSGCTAYLIDDPNHCLLTAGHCGPGAGDTVEFNVPLSSPTGAIIHPPPEDQYAVDGASAQWVSGGVGNDWGYFGCFPNANTGLTPFEAQGDFYTLADVAPPAAGQTIRITGYGTVSPPVPLTWNQVQKTHTGPYLSHIGTTLEYQVDTTGGNSGSPVIFESTGEVIGIHTHAGCTTVDGNLGTAIENSGLQNALANPQGVCIPGPGDDCPGDCNGDNVINGADLMCWKALILAGDPAADCNGDGLLNGQDFLCLRQLMKDTIQSGGCP